MGERGRAVIVRDGKHHYHYIKTSTSLPVRLEYGPSVLDSIDDWDREEDYWIEADSWSDWAVVADFDRKLLLFYGPQGWSWNFELREDRLALIVPAWPGWEVRVAFHTIDSIAEELSLPLPPRNAAAPSPPKVSEEFSRTINIEPEVEDSFLITTFVNGQERVFMGTSWFLVNGWMPFVAPNEVFEAANSATNTSYMSVTPNGGAHLDADSGKFFYWLGYLSRRNSAIEAVGRKEGFERIYLPGGLPAHLDLLESSFETSFTRDRHERLVARAGEMLWSLEVEARKRARGFGMEGEQPEPDESDWAVDPVAAKEQLESSLAAALQVDTCALPEVPIAWGQTPREHVDHLAVAYGKR